MAEKDPLRTRVENVRKRLEAGASGANDAPKEQLLTVHKVGNFAMTVGELKGVINENPEHPKAKDFALAVRGQDDTQSIVVERVDLESVLEDKAVEVVQEVEEFGTLTHPVHRKVLGESISSKAKTEKVQAAEHESMVTKGPTGGAPNITPKSRK